MRKAFSISKILDAMGNKPKVNLNPIDEIHEPETILTRIEEWITYERKERGRWPEIYSLTNPDYEELSDILSKLPKGEFPENYTPYYKLSEIDQDIPGIVGEYYGIKLVKRY